MKKPFARVLLHIGPPKTGSTSIQHFLVSNQQALCARGIYVPSAMRHGAQHIELPLLFGPRRAGLERLGYGEAMHGGVLEADGTRFTVEVLEAARMMPAVGQGAIGLQVRADDAATLCALEAVNDANTWAAVTAERKLLSLLGGGCQMPLGVNTVFYPERGQMRLQAVLFGMEEGVPLVFGETVWAMDDPEGLAEKVAGQLG